MSLWMPLNYFYPRPPRGGRRPHFAGQRNLRIFLSTPSARRATPSTRPTPTYRQYFYPRPPRGGRRRDRDPEVVDPVFLSTPSARRATSTISIEFGSVIFLSTPSARRATGLKSLCRRFRRFLSTPSARRATNHIFFFPHSFQFLSTPSARRATKAAVVDIFQHRISIHALREEGDSVSWTIGRAEVKFLSTPSARRATHDKGLQRRVKEYFYPRPPRGGRRQDIFYDLQAEPFLSTPSARRATTEEVRPALFILFLSTPSARRATSDGRHTGSLHSDFYPRPPRGGRPGCAVNKSNQNKFLSTPSARRATANPDRGASTTSFLSTPSARRATPPLRRYCKKTKRFLSTPSARRATFPAWHKTYSKSNFYPRPPRGGRLLPLHSLDSLIRFLSTPSARRATGFRR